VLVIGCCLRFPATFALIVRRALASVNYKQ